MTGECEVVGVLILFVFLYFIQNDRTNIEPAHLPLDQRYLLEFLAICGPSHSNKHVFGSVPQILQEGPTVEGIVLLCSLSPVQIGEPNFFTTSDGRRGQRLEVKLFDDCVPSFSLFW